MHLDQAQAEPFLLLFFPLSSQVGRCINISRKTLKPLSTPMHALNCLLNHCWLVQGK